MRKLYAATPRVLGKKNLGMAKFSLKETTLNPDTGNIFEKLFLFSQKKKKIVNINLKSSSIFYVIGRRQNNYLSFFMNPHKLVHVTLFCTWHTFARIKDQICNEAYISSFLPNLLKKQLFIITFVKLNSIINKNVFKSQSSTMNN